MYFKSNNAKIFIKYCRGPKTYKRLDSTPETNIKKRIQNCNGIIARRMAKGLLAIKKKDADGRCVQMCPLIVTKQGEGRKGRN